MLADTSIYTDFSSLTELKKGAREETPQAIKQVSKQFESMFIQMMLKSMRDTVPENELFGSNAERMYLDMYDKQMSLHVANGKGIGLAKVIERQLSGQQTGEELKPEMIRQYIDYPVPSAQSYKPKSDVVISGINSHDPIQKNVVSDTQEKDEVQASSDRHSIVGPWQTPEDFVNDIWPYALRAADALGVDPDVLVAQSALETGWGKHLPLHQNGSNSFNLFGIKADSRWQGDRVEITTREFRHGSMQYEQAKFRAYDSVGEAFEDYTQFILQSPRYQSALERGYDADAYASELQKAGYATDPDYASKIKRIRQNELLQSQTSELKNSTRVPLS